MNLRPRACVLCFALLAGAAPAQEDVPDVAGPKSAAGEEASGGNRRKAITKEDRNAALRAEEEKLKREAEEAKRLMAEMKLADAEARAKAAEGEAARVKAAADAQAKAEAEARKTNPDQELAARRKQHEADRQRLAEQEKKQREEEKQLALERQRLDAEEKKLAAEEDKRRKLDDKRSAEEKRRDAALAKQRAQAEAREAALTKTREENEKKKAELEAKRRALAGEPPKPPATTNPQKLGDDEHDGKPNEGHRRVVTAPPPGALVDERSLPAGLGEPARLKVASLADTFAFEALANSGCPEAKRFVVGELLASFDGLTAGTRVVLRVDDSAEAPARAGSSLAFSGLRRAGKSPDGTFVYCGRTPGVPVRP